MLTKRQKEILDYITKCIKENDYAPSLEEIKRYFKLSSVSTIHQHIEAIREKGYLKKIENQARSIELNNEEKLSDLIQVPLLGMISAGQPIGVIQEKEFIAIPKTRLPIDKNVYALRVTGNSMIEENISDGDIVLIKHQIVAKNGQKVVALINNDEATLKTLYKEKGQIRLQPANINYEPTLIKNGEATIEIQGIVIDVIKSTSLPKRILDNFKSKEKVKKYKKLPLNKIIYKDAIVGLKKLPDKSCDIIIADPPYNIGKDFGNDSDKRELTDYINWSKEWINESIRVMKPTATMLIYGFSEILAHLSTEIPINKRWLIWHYTNKNVASLNFWQRSHEAILCCWKDKPLFNRDEIREPYTEGFLNGAAGRVRAATAGRFSNGTKKTIYKAHERGALPRDVIKMPALAGGAGKVERWFLCKTCNDVFEPKELKNHKNHDILKHPTQKPLELSRRLIRSAKPKKNGVVLVPFVGTGSECVAAKELGQKYIGFEINLDYIKIAKKTLSKTIYQGKLI